MGVSIGTKGAWFSGAEAESLRGWGLRLTFRVGTIKRRSGALGAKTPPYYRMVTGEVVRHVTLPILQRLCREYRETYWKPTQMCRLRLILAIALCAVYRSHIRNDCSSFSLSNPTNAGLLFSATLITDTLSREVLGTAEGVSSLGTMLDLFDTPEQDMFTLSIENDSSQSEFLINFDNSAVVNGPGLFGSGASNLTGSLTNSTFSSPIAHIVSRAACGWLLSVCMANW